MSTVQAEYEYGRKDNPYPMLATLEGFGSALFAIGSLTNQRDGLLLGRIPVSATAFSLLLGLFAVGAFAACWHSVRLALLHRKGRRRIILTASAIVVPTSRDSVEEVAIGYRTISALSVSGARQVERLHITHANGWHSIHARMLPSLTAFYEITSTLIERSPQVLEWPDLPPPWGRQRLDNFLWAESPSQSRPR